MQRETYRQGIRQKQKKFFNEKIKPALKRRLHWKLQNACKDESGSFLLTSFFWSTSFRGRKNKVHSIPLSGSSLHSTWSFILSTTDQQYCQCLYDYLIIVYHYTNHISGNHQPTILSKSVWSSHCVSLYQSYIICIGNHQPTRLSVSLTSTSATTLLSPHPHFCMMYSMRVKWCKCLMSLKVEF